MTLYAYCNNWTLLKTLNLSFVCSLSDGKKAFEMHFPFIVSIWMWYWIYFTGTIFSCPTASVLIRHSAKLPLFVFRKSACCSTYLISSCSFWQWINLQSRCKWPTRFKVEQLMELVSKMWLCKWHAVCFTTCFNPLPFGNYC